MARRRGLGGPFFLMLGMAAGISVGRRWLDVVEVRGGSMAPSLLPGDRLLVESHTYQGRQPRPGEVVLAPDPREPERELIKRVASVDAAAAAAELRGDAPAASTDSREFGAVPLSEIRWRAVFRYWPPQRAGRLVPDAYALRQFRTGRRSRSRSHPDRRAGGRLVRPPRPG